MFRNLFNKAPPCVEPGSAGATDPAAEALRLAIAERRKEDPLIGPKIGGRDIAQRLIAGLKTDKGVHVETLLCALGSLAGYSCQTSVRSELVQNKGLAENTVFVVVEGPDGKRYYFGYYLNKPLVEEQYSIWGLAAGAAQYLGSADLIDIKEVFAHVAQTVGGESFGIPRIPQEHKPADVPINYVRFLWPQLLPIVKQYCERPSEWPVLFGLAIQEVLYLAKGAIDPTLALSIVMESAVPMSKVDFDAH